MATTIDDLLRRLRDAEALRGEFNVAPGMPSTTLERDMPDPVTPPSVQQRPTPPAPQELPQAQPQQAPTQQQPTQQQPTMPPPPPPPPPAPPPALPQQGFGDVLQQERGTFHATVPPDDTATLDDPQARLTALEQPPAPPLTLPQQGFGDVLQQQRGTFDATVPPDDTATLDDLHARLTALQQLDAGVSDPVPFTGFDPTESPYFNPGAPELDAGVSDPDPLTGFDPTESPYFDPDAPKLGLQPITPPQGPNPYQQYEIGTPADYDWSAFTGSRQDIQAALDAGVHPGEVLWRAWQALRNTPAYQDVHGADVLHLLWKEIRHMAEGGTFADPVDTTPGTEPYESEKIYHLLLTSGAVTAEDLGIKDPDYTEYVLNRGWETVGSFENWQRMKAGQGYWAPDPESGYVVWVQPNAYQPGTMDPAEHGYIPVRNADGSTAWLTPDQYERVGSFIELVIANGGIPPHDMGLGEFNPDGTRRVFPLLPHEQEAMVAWLNANPTQRNNPPPEIAEYIRRDKEYKDFVFRGNYTPEQMAYLNEWYSRLGTYTSWINGTGLFDPARQPGSGTSIDPLRKIHNEQHGIPTGTGGGAPAPTETGTPQQPQQPGPQQPGPQQPGPQQPGPQQPGPQQPGPQQPGPQEPGPQQPGPGTGGTGGPDLNELLALLQQLQGQQSGPGSDEIMAQAREAIQQDIALRRDEGTRNIAEQMARRGVTGSSIEGDAIRNLERDLASLSSQRMLEVSQEQQRLQQQESQFARSHAEQVASRLQQESQFARSLNQADVHFAMQHALQSRALDLQEMGMKLDDAYRWAALEQENAIRNRALDLQERGMDLDDAYRWAALEQDKFFRNRALDLQERGLDINAAYQQAYFEWQKEQAAFQNVANILIAMMNAGIKLTPDQQKWIYDYLGMPKGTGGEGEGQVATEVRERNGQTEALINGVWRPVHQEADGNWYYYDDAPGKPLVPVVMP